MVMRNYGLPWVDLPVAFPRSEGHRKEKQETRKQRANGIKPPLKAASEGKIARNSKPLLDIQKIKYGPYSPYYQGSTLRI